MQTSRLSETLNIVLDPFQALVTQVWAKLPSVLGALLLLLIGSFIAGWLRRMLEKALKFADLDGYSDKVGVSAIIQRLGVGRSPTAVVGFLVFWLVFLAFLLSAANVVQLTVVSEFLQQVVLFVPKLIAAVLVLGGGLFLGHFAGEVVYNSAKANEVKGADLLSRVTYAIVIVFSAIMALQRLGIDTSILSQSLQIIIASIGLALALAFGLAFGMAGKDKAGTWIDRLTESKR